MEDYIGRICPYCQNEILPTDTVVVCPSCGVVHHKHCWDQNNGCTSLGCPQYSTGAAPSAPENTCVKCGAVIAQNQAFCPNCGSPTSAPIKNRCLKCNAELESQQAFCPNCGHQVGMAVTPAAPMTPPYGYNPYQPPVTVAPKKKSKAPIIIILAILALIVILTVAANSCDSSSDSSYISSKDDFSDLFSAYANESWCYISADGSYMKIDTNPYNLEDEMDLDAYYAIQSINSRLDFSSALFSKMGETSALDGRQSDSNDDYSVSWKYHPDSGLEVTYEMND